MIYCNFIENLSSSLAIVIAHRMLGIARLLVFKLQWFYDLPSPLELKFLKIFTQVHTSYIIRYTYVPMYVYRWSLDVMPNSQHIYAKAQPTLKVCKCNTSPKPFVISKCLTRKHKLCLGCFSTWTFNYADMGLETKTYSKSFCPENFPPLPDPFKIFADPLRNMFPRKIRFSGFEEILTPPWDNNALRH